MTRSLLWKEVRQQWAVLLVMAVSAVCGVLALRPLLATDLHSYQLLAWVPALAAWGYGLVCGALLLADETEEGTQAFLDTLPCTRNRLWNAKVLAGLVLVAVQTATLTAAAHFLFEGRPLFSRPAVVPVGILVLGLTGLGFGLYGGARAATVLGGIGRGVLAQAAIGLALYPFFIALAINEYSPGKDAGVLYLAAAVIPGFLMAGAAVRSWQIYCRTDRLREVSYGRLRPPQAWDEAIRLASRDVRWFAVALLAVSVLALAAIALGAASWPTTTTLIGLACGLSAAVTGTRRPGGSHRPAGRDLYARVGVRFGVALLAVSLTVLLPLAVMFVAPATSGRDFLLALAGQFRVAGATLHPANALVFLPTWLLNGFAVGLSCGFLTRGSFAAGLLAVPGAGILAASSLVTERMAGELDALDVWILPVLLSAVALALTRVRAGEAVTGHGADAAWYGAFRTVAWNSRWFAFVLTAAVAIVTASRADHGMTAWLDLTVGVGIACGLAAAAGKEEVLPGRPGEQGLSGGERLVVRGGVHLALGLVVLFLTILAPLVLAELTPDSVLAALLRGRSGRLRGAFYAPLPPLGAGLLTGFTFGLFCGLFVRGSRVAGLLALPAVACLVTFLQGVNAFGLRAGAFEGWGAPVLLLAAFYAASRIQLKKPVLPWRANAATAATLIVTLWAATLVVTICLAAVY